MKKIKLIALLAAIVLCLATYQFLKEIGKPAEVPRTEVVVAAVDIVENTQITADMIAVKPIATEALLPGYLMNKESVIGKVMKADMFAGEMITSNRIAPLGEAVDASSTLAYVIEPGMRAFTTNITFNSANAYMVKPGNRVDLILQYNKKKPGPREEYVITAVMDMQNLLILAVDNSMNRGGLDSYASVTFQVTPEEAVRLSLVETTTYVRMVLRSSLDEEIAEVKPLDEEHLFN